MWQKTYRVRLDGADAPPGRGRRGVARAVPGVLRVRGEGLPRPYGRSRARRGRVARGPERRHGAVLRRRVLHLHDARGTPFFGLDHLQRLPGRRRRHDGGPGPPPHPRQRPALRAHDAPRVAQGGGQNLAAHTQEPGRVLRRARRGRDPRRLRRPQAPVGQLQEHPAQRPHPLGAARDPRPAAIAGENGSTNEQTQTRSKGGTHDRPDPQSEEQNEERQPGREPRDAAYWAKRVERLEVTAVPDGASNVNVRGRREVGALQGFGQLWQKTYRVRLSASR